MSAEDMRIPMKVSKDDLFIQGLDLNFPEEKKTFNKLNLHIKAKEKVLLLGPSGSGKSTLLNVLGGLIPSVIHASMQADNIQLISNKAFVFQDPDAQFTMPTVEEELAFVLENLQLPKGEIRDKALQILENLNLPVSLDTNINTLSGGMKQKLSIASALLQNPSCLFLDEPSSMLDEAARKTLWNTVESIWDNLTVIIIEHRVDYIWDKVDRVLLMNKNGEIVADDTPQNILDNCLKQLNNLGVWHPYSWEQAPVFKKIKPEEAILTVEDLTIRRKDKTLFTVDKLTVNKGEWLTLEGPNGSGKTTFLNSIMKLIPSHGSIKFKGKVIKKTKDIVGQVYPVFQNPELQFITHKVYDEIFINMENLFDIQQAQKETESLLKAFDLSHVAHLNPLELSMGQKRRLSVATALGGLPDLLLLDEPTFGLDQKNTFDLLNHFHNLISEGTSIIMISHDYNILKRYPSRRLEIRNGQLIEKEVSYV